ncbi:hypothetical protein BO83DRAFT_380756 [Aspergillus eucalypticola CBS 122712]|uniref:Uncharacterized protein n=1 Tax=Aspergillus eucalypticola (strain CBS 122712 / IBT 29274) TaxID=1448314 RepID=A0A317UY03_ASPEC|nr:uncharacterized protein BO83DRAFT_380756 [Aspergillus eucalypticola CBS 122712]PWY66934.1 hypothetical protein BO83DRAFT_380756 [Aspergillus eucalypticola CBS 122712]
MSSEDERHRKAAHLASLRRRRWVSKWGWARIRADRRAVGDLGPSSAPVVPVWVATQVLTSEETKNGRNFWSQLRPCEKCQFGEGPSRMRGPPSSRANQSQEKVVLDRARWDVRAAARIRWWQNGAS